MRERERERERERGGEVVEELKNGWSPSGNHIISRHGIFFNGKTERGREEERERERERERESRRTYNGKLSYSILISAVNARNAAERMLNRLKLRIS